jgi:ABC-type multidrug transport system fused ATPase/permease subunit
VVKVRSDSIFVPLRLFLRDFAAYARAKGFKALVFGFLGAIVESVGLVLLIPFFSVIIDAQNSGGWVQRTGVWLFALFSAESRLSKLSLLVAFFAVLMIARAVIITVRDVTMAELEIGYIQQIRSRITRRLAAAPWDTVSRLRHSRITHLMGTDIDQLNSATYILLRDAVAVVMLASQIVLAFILAPLLAALALGVVLLGAVTLLPLINRARGIGSFVTNANLSLIDDITQFLGALKLAVSQNLQDSFTREFEATLDDLRAQQIHYVRQQTVTRLAVTTASGVVGAIAILLGVAVFDISPSVLITLLLVLSRMSGPAMQLQLDAQQIAHALPAFEKIRELERDLTAAEVPTIAPAGSAVFLADGPIAFKKVSFLHDAAANESGTQGGVRDLDLVIEAGSIVGITGQSGAGKTTFADLLVGLYPPQSGEIVVGGVALRGPAVTAWRNTVSYVAQDPFLFHDTIRRNLLWANPDVDEATLWSVLRMVGAEEIVRNVGIDAVMGERGGLLSGGERQRLCLARALLRHPRLLVLDEATSALDIEGEHALLDRLLQLVPRPTIVMIAHRHESLRHCQRVLVFEGSRLVSDGAPEPIVGWSRVV